MADSGFFANNPTPTALAQLNALVALATADKVACDADLVSCNAAVVAATNAAGTWNLSSVAITGGNINGTTIGGTTPAAGHFTTLSTTSTASFGGAVTISSGTIDGTPIGATTPSSGAFTSLKVTAGSLFQWYLSSAATDQKYWDSYQDATHLYFRAVNDAQTGANTWLTLNRGSGYTLSGATFGCALTVPALTATGAVTFTSGTINGTSVGATTPSTGAFTTLTLTTALSPSYGGTGVTVAPAHGHCQLTLAAGSLKLSPYNGQLLKVNGALCTIPSAGVTLAATGLTASTFYYIYATASAGAVNALVASTTTHATSATAGNIGTEIMSGDDTKSLVGAVYVVSGPAFADSATQRYVISWFNRRRKSLAGFFNANHTTTSVTPTYVEVGSEIRVNWINWADEPVALSWTGGGWNSGAFLTFTSLAVDSTTAALANSFAAWSYNTNAVSSLAIPRTLSPTSEGATHYATILGCVSSASTGAWSKFSSAGVEQFGQIQGEIWG
jgi:hypothetical protein